MLTLTPSHLTPATLREAFAGGAPAKGRKLPMPVPLLLQLLRPINCEDDVDSLAAHLDCARARGCF